MPASARVRFARGVLRRYPWIRGRWRLASLLLTGSPHRPERLGRVAPQLPDGDLVRSEDGLAFRVRQDPMYLGPVLFGSYEPVLSGFVRRLLHAGDNVVDAGANFGWFTTLFAHLVGPAGRVVGFEPLPFYADMAREALNLNGLEGVAKVEVAALGSEEGSLIVHTFDALPLGHASALDLGRRDARPHRCPMLTLDKYLAGSDLGPVDFIKIDVEGHEPEVLLGAVETLSRPGAPIVHFEVSPEYLHATGRDASELQGMLTECGYTDFWQVDPARGIKPWEAAIPDRRADYIAAKPNTRNRVDGALR